MQSFDSIKEKLIKLNNEYKRLCEMLSFEEVYLDNKLFVKLEKQKQNLKPIALKFDEYLKVEDSIKEYSELLSELNNNERELYLSELESLNKKKIELENNLQKELLNLDKVLQDIIIEIVCKNGSKLFNDIINGYINFCKNNNFEVSEIKNKGNTKLNISGINSLEYFKNEVGLHNNQENESVMVFVYENINLDSSFKEEDIKVETCRSSGAGGQHVNTTDSAIKVTHIPTGITATCQNERSQVQNKQKAIENLKEKVSKHFDNIFEDNVIKQKKQQMAQMKNIIKVYNYENNKILKSDKSEISLIDFIKGDII